MKRLSLVIALALLCVAGLSAVAGPAAAVKATAPQWGGHEINAKFEFVGFDEETIVFAAQADDPRVCGTMYVTIENMWDDEDGLAHSSGTLDLYNDDGRWHCDYWECVYSRSLEAEHPWQGLMLPCTAKGSGDYKGLVFLMSHHQAVNSPWILKGWILAAK